MGFGAVKDDEDDVPRGGNRGGRGGMGRGGGNAGARKGKQAYKVNDDDEFPAL